MKASIASCADVDLCLQAIGAVDPVLVVFFASPRHDGAAIAGRLRAAFPAAAVVGCSTAGEISSAGMTEGEVTVMALPEAVVRRAVAVPMTDLTAVADALETLAGEWGQRLDAVDPATHVGLVLVDGLSGAEERLMEKLGDLTDVAFVGGSAGDDLQFERTYVSTGGGVYEKAAVLVLLEVAGGYEVLKTQSFRRTGKLLTATKVDDAARVVLEFNGKPASEAYAQALGVESEDLPGKFMHYPLGLMVGDEPFVRSPQRLGQDGAIHFYCHIREDADLEILESADIIADTEEALREKMSRLGRVGGILSFNCILRTLELRRQGRCEEYGRLFAEVPAIGFSTYGEQYIGHMNQTATMLVLGSAG